MQKDYNAVPSGAPDASIGDSKRISNFWSDVWSEQPVAVLDARASAKKDEFRASRRYLESLPRGARVLDGGCGLGETVLYLGSRGFDVVGVDLSESTILRLQSAYPDGKWFVEDIRALRFADKSFDAYVSWGTFEHFETGIDTPLIEARRVLKPGGLLLFSVPHDSWRMIWGRMRAPSTPTSANNAELEFYQWRFTRKEIALEVTRQGLDVEAVLPIHAAQGVHRTVMNLTGRAPSGRIGALLTRGLGKIVPGAAMGHMLLVAARKPHSRTP